MTKRFSLALAFVMAALFGSSTAVAQTLGSAQAQTLPSVNLTATTNQIVTGAGSNLTTVNFPASSGAVTLTMPITADTMMGRATTDTMTNKTLTAPVFGGTITGTYTLGGTPTLVAPALGAATATTLNGNTFTTGSYTLTGTAGKTFTFNNSLTLAGTDSTTMTFPTTSATIARTDAANTFTGTQTVGALVYTTLNGNTWATGTGTLSIAAAKTLTASNSLTLAGTDSTTMTFPTTSATIARTDAGNTFTGVQTMTSPAITTPAFTGTATGTYTLGGTPTYGTTAGALLSSGTAGVGYATGAGGTVTQLTSRTTGVTLNKTTGQITMFSAAGSATAASFTVSNTTVAAGDTIVLNEASGTNLYEFFVTAITGGTSFQITFFTTGGTATDAPVINFTIIKGVTS